MVGQRFPVVNVFWEDCQEFCEKAGLSLPTEAQWEYSCRAGSVAPYGGTGLLDEMGWYGRNSSGTHPVGQKKPNGFGIHDMHGNAAEWCQDYYDADFYRKPEANAFDPVCTAQSDARVFRGGDGGNKDRACRSASRHYYRPSGFRILTIGFRPTYYPLP